MSWFSTARSAGEPAAQMTADLLRTRSLRRQLTEQLAQLAVALDTTSVLAGSTGDRADEPRMGDIRDR